MNAKLLLIAPIVLFTAVSNAQSVRLDANCVPQMTRLESRLYEKAEEGPGVLRNFISIRRGIYELDIRETATWAARVRAARSACKAVTTRPGNAMGSVPDATLAGI